MNRELSHVQNPKRIRRLWVIAYSILAIGVIFGLYALADNIRTRIPPVGQIELKVHYSKYLLGESVSYTITNKFNSPVLLPNNCPSEPLAVYRLESSKWVRIHDTLSKKDCSGESRRVSIPANGLISATLDDWPNLFNKVGKYRIVAYVDGYNDLPYQQFEFINPKIVKAKPVSKTSSSNASPAQQNTTPSSSRTTETEEEDDDDIPPVTTKKSKTVTVSAGSISVQYDSARVYVTSIAPASGCSYEGGRSGTEVEVTFKCGDTETQVQLRVVNGALQSKVETESDD